MPHLGASIAAPSGKANSLLGANSPPLNPSTFSTREANAILNLPPLAATLDQPRDAPKLRELVGAAPLRGVGPGGGYLFILSLLVPLVQP